MNKEIRELINRYADEGLVRIILSNSRVPAVQKEKVRPVLIKQSLKFQAETFKGAQAFHENIEKDALAAHIDEMLETTFKQAQIEHACGTASVLVSKKGTVTIKEKKVELNWKPLAVPEGNNRSKKYLIPEGTPVPFMKDLGVFTAEGKVVSSRTDKYRQINRFLEFIDDIVPELPKDRPVNILDFGCGKSYLTFAVYYFLTEIRGLKVNITGLDLKEAVVADCERLARSYGYDGLSFKCGDVSDFDEYGSTDMMMTLHACDTATDYALAYAVKTGAKVVLSVPCCQHELNSQFDNTALSPLFRYGIIKERISALATDALRAELLTAHGYKVQLLEFIDMEHTPKNILIRAVKRARTDKASNEAARERVGAFVKEYGIEPTLYRLLECD